MLLGYCLPSIFLNLHFIYIYSCQWSSSRSAASVTASPVPLTTLPCASISGIPSRPADSPVYTATPAIGPSSHPSALTASSETPARPWKIAASASSTASSPARSPVWAASTDATTASRSSRWPADKESRDTLISPRTRSFWLIRWKPRSDWKPATSHSGPWERSLPDYLLISHLWLIEINLPYPWNKGRYCACFWGKIKIFGQF